MSEFNIDSGAGAAPTATGPDDTKADCSVPHNSVNEGFLPDEKPLNLGADLLDRVLAYARRFICYPSDEAGIAHVLWIAHTHLMDAWFSTPRLAVLSPEPGSGKSRVLEITALLVPNPLLSVNSSPAYILRKVADEENRPTILYDEIDTIFGPAARGNEDLRSMFNAGYRRGATAGRCFVDRGKVVPEELPTFAALAMGGLGNLPDTIMSRSVIIRMRRRANGEIVEPFKPRTHVLQAAALRDELVEWAASVIDMAEIAQPAMPDCISDRNEDVWGPLFTVADLAGGQWPNAARNAAINAVQTSKANERPTIGVQLLADIHACFGNADRIPTTDLLDKLLADNEAPWGDLRGKKIDARKLGKMLREYGIHSSTIRLPNGSTPKGYKREEFDDAWKRYLPTSKLAATSATAATNVEAVHKTEISDVTSESVLPAYDGEAAEPRN